MCQINTKVGSSVTYNATKKSTKINPCKIYDSQCGRYGPQIVLSANMTDTAHRGESLDRFCQPMWQLRPIRGNTLNFFHKMWQLRPIGIIPCKILSANVAAKKYRGNPLIFLSANVADIANRVNILQIYDREYDRIMCDSQCGGYSSKGVTFFSYVVLDTFSSVKQLKNYWQ